MHWPWLSTADPVRDAIQGLITGVFWGKSAVARMGSVGRDRRTGEFFTSDILPG
jgi:hypothetical protein